MKHLFLVAICLSFLFLSNGQNVKFDWVKKMGAQFYDQGIAVATDNSGHVYTMGNFQGTSDFDPGAGTASLTSTGFSDIYIQKLDTSGNFVWVKQLGGANWDYGISMNLDASGNILLTGRFQGTSDFDPGTGVANLTSNGSYDIFVVKLDSSGSFQWAKQMGGTSDDVGTDVKADLSGNIYTTGRFRLSVDFDPSAGVDNITTNGSDDIFIQKLGPNGNYIWTKKIGGGNYDAGNSLEIDKNGNILTTGVFQSIVDFDPGAGTHNLTSGGTTSQDVFILKLDSTGSFVWARAFGNNGGDRGIAIETDTTGNVYTTGLFSGTVDFDPGTSISNLTSVGNHDYFIQKLDTGGNFLWAGNIGGDVYSLITDISGNVYLTGKFSGTADFNPGTGTTNLTSVGYDDIFIEKLSTNGNFLWVKRIGGGNYDKGHDLAIDNVGNLYTTGDFQSYVDFDPGQGQTGYVSSGYYDAFIQKMRPCAPIMSIDTHVVCDSLAWIDGNTYTSSNTTATHTLFNIHGCDSVIHLNLTVNQSTATTDTHVVCDSLNWIDGNTYTSSNTTATHTLTSSTGCDSVVTLNLTVNKTTGIDVQTACNTYTWIDGNTYTTSNSTATHTLTNVAGCDSLVTLNLTINTGSFSTDIQTACGSYVWIDGNTYTSSNSTATHTLTNVAGCDSVVTLNLTINNASASIDTIVTCDSLTWIDGNTYTSSNTTATHTLTNVAGCDSVITLNLIINNSFSSVDTKVVCDSLVWVDGNTYTNSNTTATYSYTASTGCDSIVRLNLTVNKSTSSTDTKVACDSYTWIDGNTYTSSNTTATHTLTNSTGCDSIVTLNLTIQSVSDTSLTVNGITISANNAIADEYQWLDCSNNYAPIAGATNKDYTATLNGSYAVQLKENNCTDTSRCVEVKTIGLEELKALNQVQIYPNPGSGVFVLNIGDLSPSEVRLTIYDVKGKLVRIIERLKMNHTRFELNVAPGVYFVNVQTKSKTKEVKLIVR